MSSFSASIAVRESAVLPALKSADAYEKRN